MYSAPLYVDTFRSVQLSPNIMATLSIVQLSSHIMATFSVGARVGHFMLFVSITFALGRPILTRFPVQYWLFTVQCSPYTWPHSTQFSAPPPRPPPSPPPPPPYVAYLLIKTSRSVMSRSETLMMITRMVSSRRSLFQAS